MRKNLTKQADELGEDNRILWAGLLGTILFTAFSLMWMSQERAIPKIELYSLDADKSERITVAISADDMQVGDTRNPERHPVAIALRRKRGVDDARVSRREVLIRRGNTWYRYHAPKLVED